MENKKNEIDIMQEIMNLKEDEIDSWINNRIQVLEETAIEDRKEITSMSYAFRRANSNGNMTEVRGYIPSKTQLKEHPLEMSAFCMDDISYYKDLIRDIQKIPKNRLINDEESMNHNFVMRIVGAEIVSYLGLQGNQQLRDRVYSQTNLFNDDEKPLSISDFKRNGSAMCLERSAMAQNMLSFLGYDPMMIIGHISTDTGVNNELHAYNCIIRNGKAMLADFTNPIKQDGKYLRPACFPINQENLDDFMKGEAQVEVQHKDFYTENCEKKEKIISIVYASQLIDEKYFEKKKMKEMIALTTEEVTDTDISQTVSDIQKGKKQEKSPKSDRIPE